MDDVKTNYSCPYINPPFSLKMIFLKHIYDSVHIQYAYLCNASHRKILCECVQQSIECELIIIILLLLIKKLWHTMQALTACIWFPIFSICVCILPLGKTIAFSDKSCVICSNIQLLIYLYIVCRFFMWFEDLSKLKCLTQYRMLLSISVIRSVDIRINRTTNYSRLMKRESPRTAPSPSSLTYRYTERSNNVS